MYLLRVDNSGRAIFGRRMLLGTRHLPGAHAHGPAAVCISQAEYDGLVKVVRQYARLRENLLRGGIDEDTIAILSNEEPSSEQSQATTLDYDTASHPDKQYEQVSKTPSLGNPRRTSQDYTNPSFKRRHGANWDEVDSFSENASMSIDSSIGGVPVTGSTICTSTPPSPQVDRLATRTILLCNLAEGVTHADITAAIRGGQLLDVYLRHRDRTASVSWGDRQFNLPGHVAHKISVGATRNLVIRNCDPNNTEETIREDLEHIHNLVVIQVDFVRGDCFIKTSSIHNAMFARTCMMSRAKYRGSRIQWAADECAEPLAQVPVPRRSSAPAVKTPANHMTNRFQLLDLRDDGKFGDAEDADDDDSDDTLH
ncbi:hypothetical protein G7Z17_g1574 [Cylindrodendrum hubeiense]|uniref:Uncharacterized protein n=1 Tax=Cylindrodendrum hubeiense TaxID=595255 RepID=A0A9P5HPR3_9HYPO|nr:hypothetical protein G7Z17_g1574 [Cylindrodendrum hubeiense]